jgi:hypothetical protein
MEQLKRGVKIKFVVGDDFYLYEVTPSYLDLRKTSGEYSNAAIFKALDISEDEKYELATKYYGYSVSQGVWPSYKDYKSATELVKYLYDLCNIHNTK